jgi:hypothetical protein
MSHDESPKKRPLVNLHGDAHIRAGPMNAKSVRFNGQGMTNAAPFVTLRGNMLFDNVEFDGFASPVLSVVAENGARVSKCSFRAPALEARRLAEAEAAKSFALVNVEKGTFVAQRAEFTNERVRGICILVYMPWICVLGREGCAGFSTSVCVSDAIRMCAGPGRGEPQRLQLARALQVQVQPQPGKHPTQVTFGTRARQLAHTDAF